MRDRGPRELGRPVELLEVEGAARVGRDGVVVFVRAPVRYGGVASPIDPVAGHIPGALNAPFATVNLAAEDAGTSRFRGLDDARALYEQAGVRTDREVGVYCGSGVTATHTVFTLRRLGVDAALYPGSWSEWVSDPDRPVATGA